MSRRTWELRKGCLCLLVKFVDLAGIREGEQQVLLANLLCDPGIQIRKSSIGGKRATQGRSTGNTNLRVGRAV